MNKLYHTMFCRYFFLIILTNFIIAGTINIPNDYSEIQMGINISEHGDTILVEPGVYSENINFSGKNIIVISSMGPEVTEIVSVGTGAAVTLNSNESHPAEFSGFKIEGAFSNSNGGAIHVYESSVFFKNLIIQYNAAFNMGGGIYINGGEQIFYLCKIKYNEIGDTNGGGIYCINSNLILDSCQISNNHSPKNGGGLYLNNSDVEVINSIITFNNENADAGNPMPSPKGGGIYAYQTNLLVSNCIINNNESYGPGGGIYAQESNVEIEKTELCKNSSLYYWQDAQGGAASFYNSDVFINQVTATDNISNSLQQYNSDGFIFRGSSAGIVINSIIYNNEDVEIRLIDNSCLNIDYSDILGDVDNILGNSLNCLEYGNNNIDNPPQFIDLTNDNYGLSQNSPCIDLGTADIDDDGIYDIIEFSGISPDMGAHEFILNTDLNSDGFLNILDIIVLVNCILDTICNDGYDLNLDGNIDILDIYQAVLILLQH